MLGSLGAPRDRPAVRPSEGFPPAFAFAARRGFWSARTLAGTFDSLVRVSRRAAGDRRASVLAAAALVAAAARSSARGARAAETGVCKSPPAEGRPRSPGPPARARAGAGPDGAGCGVQPPWRGSPRRPAPPEFGSRALPPRQFHVLFDPLSRVLFIFRSLYLCAIGLRPVFSLGRNLPPALGSTPKLPDSSRDTPPGGGPGPRRAAARGSHPLRRPVPGDSAGAPRGARRAGGGGSLSRLQLGPPA